MQACWILWLKYCSEVTPLVVQCLPLCSVLYYASSSPLTIQFQISGKQRKIAKYYKKQENLLKDFSEMETMNELGGLDQNGPSEVRLHSTDFLQCSMQKSTLFFLQDTDWILFFGSQEELRQLAKSERFAINLSNIINLILFVTKVVASAESLSMAVIASTLDSLLDLLSGFILWFTAHAMKKPNKYNYPIGKRRMQPVVTTLFAELLLWQIL